MRSGRHHDFALVVKWRETIGNLHLQLDPISIIVMRQDESLLTNLQGLVKVAKDFRLVCNLCHRTVVGVTPAMVL